MILLFIVFCPIVSALAILCGAPARRTAFLATALTLAATLLAYFQFDLSRGGFEYVVSFPISDAWRLSFTLGLDGLSLIMVLLTAIVTFAAKRVRRSCVRTASPSSGSVETRKSSVERRSTRNGAITRAFAVSRRASQAAPSASASTSLETMRCR